MSWWPSSVPTGLEVDHAADVTTCCRHLRHSGGRRRRVTTEPALVRSRIGYVGQANGAGHSFRVRDELVNQGRFYGMNSTDAAGRADELLASLDLVPLAKRRVSTLSGGQRRRLDLASG